MSNLYLFDWTKLSPAFDSLFRKHYPAYVESVGVQGLRVRLEPEGIAHKIVAELWKRQWPATPSSDDMEVLLSEFEQFVDTQTIDVDCLAPLEGFRADGGVDEIPLPNGVTIRRLTEREVSELFGGWDLEVGVLCEFALVGQFQLDKRLGAMPPVEPGEAPTLMPIQKTLNRTETAMRCFKSGGLSYRDVRITPRKFVPFPMPGSSTSSSPVAGSYKVSHDEVPALQQHVGFFSDSLHLALELAAERLAEAEGRTRQRDRLLDAVIGLEAVLLFNPGSEVYRGELRYRFAVNYSTLAHPPAQRYIDFKSAQAVYDTRSAIAHGARVEDEELVTRADEACQMLRKVIKRFLPAAGSPPYLRPDYWTREVLGTPTGD